MPLPQQKIRFTVSPDGARLAYATAGEGPPLVKAANWLSHLEFDWGSPVWRHWLSELTRDHMLVRYDERGCGLSDWDVADFSLDAWVRDLETVVDALGLERFPLLGISQGGPIAIAYAVRHPERVSHLVLYGSYARGRLRRDPTPAEAQECRLLLDLVRIGWGKDHPAFRQVFTTMFIPDGDEEQTRWFNELARVSSTPENAARLLDGFYALDVLEAAARVAAPTLVLHGTGDLRVPFEEGRLLASLIPDARFVPLESRNHLLLAGEPAWPRFLQEVRAFLGVPARVSGPSAARRRTVFALFDRAMELSGAERAALVAAEAADDPSLRQDVERLLALAEQSGLTAQIGGAIPTLATHVPPAAPPPQVGPYRLLEPLGGGGMGQVWRARDCRLDRAVALKFLHGWLAADDGVRRRFRQEALAVAGLDHPNICTIYEVGEVDGWSFIAMPCYAGETLRQRIARGPVAWRDAVEWAAQAADGLAHAHAMGVVHRDVKPANLIVGPDGRVRVLDFGIAKVAGTELTRPGTVLGTMAYMSPEQADGRPVDARADLWSLGVVLYEMLAGRPPFRGATVEELLDAILQAEPDPLATLRPEVPETVTRLTTRLLAREPDRRPADGAAVARELRRAADG